MCNLHSLIYRVLHFYKLQKCIKNCNRRESHNDQNNHPHASLYPPVIYIFYPSRMAHKPIKISGTIISTLSLVSRQSSMSKMGVRTCLAEIQMRYRGGTWVNCTLVHQCSPCHCCMEYPGSGQSLCRKHDANIHEDTQRSNTVFVLDLTAKQSEASVISPGSKTETSKVRH